MIEPMSRIPKKTEIFLKLSAGFPGHTYFSILMTSGTFSQYHTTAQQEERKKMKNLGVYLSCWSLTSVSRDSSVGRALD